MNYVVGMLSGRNGPNDRADWILPLRISTISRYDSGDFFGGSAKAVVPIEEVNSGRGRWIVAMRWQNRSAAVAMWEVRGIY